MRLFGRAQIERAISPESAIAAVEEGFAAYSRGEVTVPPVGHLTFQDPPGDVHIKYGYRHGDCVFVVKIASGFYDNPKLGLSSSDGLMLVFSARTGQVVAILQDEGYLTDLRTAAAGVVAAKYLAPKQVRAIGIVGAGIQARMQLDLLRHLTACRQAVVWAREASKAAAFTVEGFRVDVASSIEDLAARCNLIVTTTPSRTPLLSSAAVRPGTHITAVGADTPGKQELDAALFARADILAVDARKQCFEYGDSASALRENIVTSDRFVELGEIICNPSLGRTSEQQITIADLTGLAIQDIQIAKAAMRLLVP